MKDRLLKQGKGWRIGWDAQGNLYKGLVGSEDWAIELSEAELNDFCRLLNQLAQTMEEMKDHLMDCERIACEAESDLLWMEVEGFPTVYSLRLILHQGRRFEGNWSAEVVKDLIAATQMLKVF